MPSTRREAAGIEHFIFVTGRNKGVIEDHFDKQYELERTLGERGKSGRARPAHGRALPRPGQTSFTRQQEPSRARPRRVVRARHRRRRAVRAAAAGHAAPRGQALPGRDDRGLSSSTAATTSPSRRCPRIRRTSTASSASRTGNGKVSRITGMVEKPRARHGALQPAHLPGATSCSRRSSRSSNAASVAPAAKFRSPMP